RFFPKRNIPRAAGTIVVDSRGAYQCFTIRGMLSEAFYQKLCAVYPTANDFLLAFFRPPLVGKPRTRKVDDGYNIIKITEIEFSFIRIPVGIFYRFAPCELVHIPGKYNDIIALAEQEIA